MAACLYRERRLCWTIDVVRIRVSGKKPLGRSQCLCFCQDHREMLGSEAQPCGERKPRNAEAAYPFIPPRSRELVPIQRRTQPWRTQARPDPGLLLSTFINAALPFAQRFYLAPTFPPTSLPLPNNPIFNTLLLYVSYRQDAPFGEWQWR